MVCSIFDSGESANDALVIRNVTFLVEGNVEVDLKMAKGNLRLPNTKGLGDSSYPYQHPLSLHIHICDPKLPRKRHFGRMKYVTSRQSDFGFRGNLVRDKELVGQETWRGRRKTASERNGKKTEGLFF